MKHSLFLLVFYCVEEASLTVLCLVFRISLNPVNPNHYTTTILYPLQAMLWLWNIFNLKWVDFFLIEWERSIWFKLQSYPNRAGIYMYTYKASNVSKVSNNVFYHKKIKF